MISSNKIIVNTIAQYVRSITNMLFSLIATRIILKVLGVEDYGIYTLIAGIVSMISFMTNALVITTQRYLSVSQGQNAKERQSNVFNTSLFIHITIAIIIVIVLEILEPFLFNGFLNIPTQRIYAARVLYQTTIVILCLSFISSPYRASIIAHENIVYTSVIEIIDGLFKLLIAVFLTFISFDKLIFYGALLTLLYIFNFFAWIFYAKSKYQECNYINIKKINIPLIKEILGFASWTIYSIGCVTGRSQGISIIVNKFWGAAMNASYGLALQISGAVISLSQSLLNAVNPQLMKAEGDGNRQKMFRLAEVESKFSFLMLSAIVVPAVFEMPKLLEIWLGCVPDFAVLFCRMVLISNCLDMLTIGLNSANQAIGKIRDYTILIYSIKLSTLLFVMISLLLGKNVLIFCVIYVIIEALSSLMRIPFLAKIGELDVKNFINNVFKLEIIPISILILSCFATIQAFSFDFRFILTFIISISLFFLSIYLFGLTEDEKTIINRIIYRILKK